MKESFVTKWQGLIDALRSDGQTVPAKTRHAVFAQHWDEQSDTVRTLLTKVAHAAYRVTAEDIAAVPLREEETFELIVCTAAGAADKTLRAGLRALALASDDAEDSASSSALFHPNESR